MKTDMAAESAAKEDARPEPDTFFTGIRSVRSPGRGQAVAFKVRSKITLLCG